MLLDEPLSSLDPHLREEMRFEIKDLQRKYGFSIIYVTHDQAEAMALSDRILVMKAGVVQQIDTPLAVYNKPANKFVFSFIGLSNFLDIAWEDGRAFVSGEPAPLPQSLIPPESMRGRDAISLASRPSEIDFVSEGDGDGLRGIVSRKAFLGEFIDYQVKIGGQELRVQKGRRAPGPELGEACCLHFLRPFWYAG
jgi:iron(III) transport system ATP-binding protein